MTLRRILEFFCGVLIVVFLIGKYNDTNSSRYLVDYIMPWQPFKSILVVILIVVAYRLIGGRTKDYSSSVYRLLVKIWGQPGQKKNVS